RQPNGSVTMSLLSDDVRSLGFDGAGRLWCLSGDRLEALVDGIVETSIDGVECVAVSEDAAYCRRATSGAEVHLYEGGHRMLAAFPDFEGSGAIQLSQNGSYLAAAILSPAAADRARMRLMRFDCMADSVQTLVDECVAIGFNGGPGVSVAQVSDGTL